MGIKPRKRRLRNFGQRASAFSRDLTGKPIAGDSASDAITARLVQRDKGIIVGAGKHRRLALKRSSFGLSKAHAAQERIAALIRAKRINPAHYSFAEAAAEPNIGIQEYFNKPSLHELKCYLEARGIAARKALAGGNFGAELARKIRSHGLETEEALICKAFLGQAKNTGVSLEMLDSAEKELEFHLRQADAFLLPSNIIVLGVNLGGKPRLALIDL